MNKSLDTEIWITTYQLNCEMQSFGYKTEICIDIVYIPRK